MGSLSANFFVPSAAQALFHLDQVGASYLISTGFTLAIFVNLLFGFLMDRFNRWKVMAALAGLGMLGGIAMTSHDLLVFRIGTALVLALGHAGIQQSYTLAADVLRGRETGNVHGCGEHGCGRVLLPRTADARACCGIGAEASWRAGTSSLAPRLSRYCWCSRCGVIHHVQFGRSRQPPASCSRLWSRRLFAPKRLSTMPRWIEPGKGGNFPPNCNSTITLGKLGSCECLRRSGYQRPSIL